MGARLVWLVCFRARLCALRVMSAWRGHSPHRGPGITAGLSFRVAAPALTCVGRVARLVQLVESELSDRLAKVTLVFCTAPIGLAPQASSPQHSVGFEGVGMQRAQHPDVRADASGLTYGTRTCTRSRSASISASATVAAKRERNDPFAGERGARNRQKCKCRAACGAVSEPSKARQVPPTA